MEWHVPTGKSPRAGGYHTVLISLSSGWQSNGYPANELNSCSPAYTTSSTRTYENISQVLAAMEVINPDGSATLFK